MGFFFLFIFEYGWSISSSTMSTEHTYGAHERSIAEMEHDEEEEPPLAVQIQGDDESVSQQSSVGVTLITGYLGAGKSTVSFLYPFFHPFHFYALPQKHPILFLHMFHSQIPIFLIFGQLGSSKSCPFSLILFVDVLLETTVFQWFLWCVELWNWWSLQLCLWLSASESYSELATREEDCSYIEWVRWGNWCGKSDDKWRGRRCNGWRMGWACQWVYMLHSQA